MSLNYLSHPKPDNPNPKPSTLKDPDGFSTSRSCPAARAMGGWEYVAAYVNCVLLGLCSCAEETFSVECVQDTYPDPLQPLKNPMHGTSKQFVWVCKDCAGAIPRVHIKELPKL